MARKVGNHGGALVAAKLSGVRCFWAEQTFLALRTLVRFHEFSVGFTSLAETVEPSKLHQLLSESFGSVGICNISDCDFFSLANIFECSDIQITIFTPMNAVIIAVVVDRGGEEDAGTGSGWVSSDVTVGDNFVEAFQKQRETCDHLVLRPHVSPDELSGVFESLVVLGSTTFQAFDEKVPVDIVRLDDFGYQVNAGGLNLLENILNIVEKFGSIERHTNRTLIVSMFFVVLLIEEVKRFLHDQRGAGGDILAR